MPCFRQLRPWVKAALTEALSPLSVNPEWLPVKELGRGASGSVMSTRDESVVLKVTTDEGEAEVARMLMNGVSSYSGCVIYHRVEATDRRAARGRVHLIWRESAIRVGLSEASSLWKDGLLCYSRLAKQIARNPRGGRCFTKLTGAIDRLSETPGGHGLACTLRGFLEAGVVLSDAHAGNFGLVIRHGAERWVVTDPGGALRLGAPSATKAVQSPKSPPPRIESRCTPPT